MSDEEPHEENHSVFFIKMIDGEDLLCSVLNEDDQYLYIKSPYRVELMQSNKQHRPSTVSIAIVRWIPFDPLMMKEIKIDKRNIMLYTSVPHDIADRYINSITSEFLSPEQPSEQDTLKMMREMMRAIANTSTRETIH